MRISNIVTERFKVYAVQLNDADHDSFVLLSNRKRPMNDRDKSALISARVRIGRLALGPEKLPKTVCHNVSDHIWQVTSDQYRILWFYDRDRVIVCTHFFVKKTRKTPPSEIARAERIRSDYFEAKAASALVVVE